MQEYWFGGEFLAFEAEIVCMANPAAYRPGEELSRQAERGDQVFYIKEGSVNVSRIHATGKKHVYGFHGPGAMCALDCLMEKAEPIVTISAAEPVTAYPLACADVFALMARNPAFARCLAEHYCSVLRFMCSAVVELTCGDAVSQVAGLLRRFAETAGSSPGCRLNMSQDEVASTLSLSRVQVARVYHRLREEGIIRTGRNFVELLVPDKLADYAPL